MNDSPQRSDAAALEAHIRAVTEAAERAAALLRALAPLRAHLAALDAAVAAVGAPAAPAPVVPEPAAPAAPGAVAGVEAAGAEIRSMAAPRSGGEANGAAPAPEARTGRTVTVTVTRADAPLDLVRVHTALDKVEGVMSLALVSYTRGRAVLQLEADRPIDELPLTEGLRAAFPEGVTTQRQSPEDIEMAIGTP